MYCVESKPRFEPSRDGQDIVYQGPDNALSPSGSGSAIDYKNISLSSLKTRKPSEITEGTDYKVQNAADSSLSKPINDKNNDKEDCAIYQGPDISINSHNLSKYGSNIVEKYPESERL